MDLWGWGYFGYVDLSHNWRFKQRSQVGSWVFGIYDLGIQKRGVKQRCKLGNNLGQLPQKISLKQKHVLTLYWEIKSHRNKGKGEREMEQGKKKSTCQEPLPSWALMTCSYLQRGHMNCCPQKGLIRETFYLLVLSVPWLLLAKFILSRQGITPLHFWS